MRNIPERRQVLDHLATEANVNLFGAGESSGLVSARPICPVARAGVRYRTLVTPLDPGVSGGRRLAGLAGAGVAAHEPRGWLGAKTVAGRTGGRFADIGAVFREGRLVDRRVPRTKDLAR
jgi:hypothetical protein